MQAEMDEIRNRRATLASELGQPALATVGSPMSGALPLPVVPQLNQYATSLAPAPLPVPPAGHLTPGGMHYNAAAAWPGAPQVVPTTQVTATPLGAAVTASVNSAAGVPGRPGGDPVGGSGSPDGDPGDDPAKRKRDKEIDDKRKGQFQINSEAIKTVKSRTPRGNVKCDVDRFERGTDLTIQDWINQMETYFMVGQVPPEAYVGFMLMKIVPRHLNEIKQYKDMDYLPFREKLIEVFAEPDLATAYLSALNGFTQERDETISGYMHRLRLLVLKAHPDLAHEHRERILVTSFVNGLYDRRLAESLAVVKPKTAAEAERIAAEGEAVRRDTRSRKFTSNVLMDEAAALPPLEEDIGQESDEGE